MKGKILTLALCTIAAALINTDSAFAIKLACKKPASTAVKQAKRELSTDIKNAKKASSLAVKLQSRVDKARTKVESATAAKASKLASTDASCDAKIDKLEYKRIDYGTKIASATKECVVDGITDALSPDPVYVEAGFFDDIGEVVGGIGDNIFGNDGAAAQCQRKLKSLADAVAKTEKMILTMKSKCEEKKQAVEQKGDIKIAQAQSKLDRMVPLLDAALADLAPKEAAVDEANSVLTSAEKKLADCLSSGATTPTSPAPITPAAAGEEAE